jgi:hypothetical protein
LLIENPHPQLVDHDELGDLFNVAGAVLAAVVVCLRPVKAVRDLWPLETIVVVKVGWVSTACWVKDPTCE